VLLHADFLDNNLPQNGTGHVGIDPMRCVGDPCSDVGCFAAGHPPSATILPRAGALASQMNLDPWRA
jgi:hypothetical protein